MQYTKFLDNVRDLAGLEDREHALALASATLQTLADRLTGGEASDLAAQLPRELAHFLERDEASTGERFGLEEMYERVSARASVDRETAERGARCVIQVLAEAVSPGELEDIKSQLPFEYHALL